MSGRGQGRGLAALAAAALDISPAQAEEGRAAPAAAPAVELEEASSSVTDAAAEPDVEAAEPATEQPRPARRPPAPRSSAVRAVPTQQPAAPEGPRYLRFEAKTVRMTAEQADELGQVEARLRRAARGKRGPGSELLTWNMVARAGIDLVLREAAAGRLSGLTEDELRASIGLDPLGF